MKGTVFMNGINVERFNQWLVNDYRMFREEFDGLDVEQQIEIIEQYENENRP